MYVQSNFRMFNVAGVQILHIDCIFTAEIYETSENLGVSETKMCTQKKKCSYSRRKKNPFSFQDYMYIQHPH